VHLYWFCFGRHRHSRGWCGSLRGRQGSRAEMRQPIPALCLSEKSALLAGSDVASLHNVVMLPMRFVAARMTIRGTDRWTGDTGRHGFVAGLVLAILLFCSIFISVGCAGGRFTRCSIVSRWQPLAAVSGVSGFLVRCALLLLCAAARRDISDAGTQRTDSETFSSSLVSACVRIMRRNSVTQSHASAECGVDGRRPGLFRRVGAVTRTEQQRRSSWPQQPKHTAPEEGEGKKKKRQKWMKRLSLPPTGLAACCLPAAERRVCAVGVGSTPLLIVGRVFPFAEQRGGAETKRCTRGRHGAAAYNSAALRPESTISW
jgi:hypothetical protein